MKHFICIQILLAFIVFQANAQLDCVVQAQVVENTTDPTNLTNADRTGNDVKMFLSVTVIVNTWDGDNPGFGWNYNNGQFTGDLPLGQSDLYEVDVTLLVDQGPNPDELYAVAAYHSGANGVCYDIFIWSSFNNAFVSVNGSSGVVIDANVTPTEVNIDGDAEGDFAIVWDDPDLTSNNIQIIGGTTNNGIPMLGSVQSIPGTTDMNTPDVTFYTNSTPVNL